MIFEDFHSFEEYECFFKHSQNLSFPIHIHRSFEFYLQRAGSTAVTVDEKEYVLSPGQALLIFPYQYHSYRAQEGSRHTICIFSPDLVPDYYYRDTPRIPLDNRLAYTPAEEVDTSSILLRRALAYSICGTFDKGRAYQAPSSSAGRDVLKSVLLYTNEHFTQTCLLRNAAQAAGYDYAYTSKLFKRQLGITYNQYVSLLRIRKSQTLLSTTSKSITEIAAACGFHSLRAFNRKFIEITGATPSDYRRKHLPVSTQCNTPSY